MATKAEELTWCGAGGRVLGMLVLSPLTLKEAGRLVEVWHRHREPGVGAVYAIGCREGGRLCGVVVVVRPISRAHQDGWTLEVTRLASDGTRNACSFLYAAAWRVARNLGYRRLITYILETERGTSLQAAGWKCVGKTRAESWDRKDRPRVDVYPLQRKLLYEAA